MCALFRFQCVCVDVFADIDRFCFSAVVLYGNGFVKRTSVFESGFSKIQSTGEALKVRLHQGNITRHHMLKNMTLTNK